MATSSKTDGFPASSFYDGNLFHPKPECGMYNIGGGVLVHSIALRRRKKAHIAYLKAQGIDPGKVAGNAPRYVLTEGDDGGEEGGDGDTAE